MQPLVAGRRTVGRHLGERADAAVIGAVEHDPPILAVARDLDHGDAVRRHLDVDQLLRHVLEAGRILTFLQGREHQLFVGVFVIDAKQPVAAAAVDREIGDVVVVVAELPELRGCALRERIERQGIREELVAPSEQGPRLVAVGDVVVDVDAGLDLLELEAIGRRFARSLCLRRALAGPNKDAMAATPSVPRIISRRL